MIIYVNIIILALLTICVFVVCGLVLAAADFICDVLAQNISSVPILVLTFAGALIMTVALISLIGYAGFSVISSISFYLI